MPFENATALADYAQRVRRFVHDTVVPYENDPRLGAHGPSDELRRELNAHARAAGVLAPQVASEYGGLGLTHEERAMVLEAAGYSALGPVALHCAAPDEGNMHLLEAVASPAQKKAYLEPLATAQVRSCFAMTEPSPGAGSDPSLMRTTAVGDGSRFTVDGGSKWLITGAIGAGFMILMANTVVNGQDVGATMFLVPLPQPAVKVVRTVNSIDASFTGGHAVLAIDGLHLTANDVLGEVGQGFRYAQVRLAPARLTHCMRWLGSATRVSEIALAYARERSAFGKPIGSHEGIGFALADNDMDLHMARLVTREAARHLDQGHPGGFESSRAKVIVSEALFRVADRCVQVLGGMGLTHDTAVARIFQETRAFRVYDGPSEVHRWSMARKLLKQAPLQP